MNLNMNHAWLALGVCLIIYALPALLMYPNFGSFISVGCGALVTYSSARNLGWIQ